MHTRANLPQRYGKRKSRKTKRWFVILLGVILILVGKYIYDHYIPSFQQVQPKYSSDFPITMNGKEAPFKALIDEDQVKLPLPLLQQWLEEDQHIHYEQDNGALVLTTSSSVLRMVVDEKVGQLQLAPYQLDSAAVEVDGVVYLPLQPLEKLYGIQVEYNAESGVTTLFHAGQTLQSAEVTKEKGVVMRIEPHIKAPYLAKVVQHEVVRVWEEEAGWFKVQNKLGHYGYVKKTGVQLTTTEQIPTLEKKEAFVAWKKPNSKINLVWEAVYGRRPDPATIGSMPGVNVISPTWFELADSKGNINEKADTAFVTWANKRDYEVWALFSNAFEPEQTTTVLANVDSRFTMIKQLLALADKYKLQGINVDFENVYTKDKENFVQFIREMTPFLHEQGLVVSVDVTPKSNSEMWSAFIDREALGKIVDYMMVMAYDEHWAASPKAGSVASLPWTEHAITKILEEDNVPSEKLILSMPLYTRIWTEKKLEDGTIKVSSKAVGMERVKNIIKEKKLTPKLDEQAGQHYVEYVEEGNRQRIWIEDELSITKRISLVHKYKLAGVASWQRAFETATIWPVIEKQLQQTKQ
ncbi:glycosyl hydrolase family 18 protein [Paenibacillus yanchengensis]|uniref:Glycosyl hydrolase family 18 protein n=1 Tax=Paenibacillus yanchengensis TaxID=2035833 RepID=A0ABW4YJ56_9BACL